MNVSIPIEELTIEQVQAMYERLYEKVEQDDTGDQFINAYDIKAPLRFYKMKSADLQLKELRLFIEYLDEAEDSFGTEGWRHCFGID